jgi:ABC-2 type transport system ATP-binding protein
MTVFVTTHYMDEADNCDRVVMVDGGKIVASGSPSEIVGEVIPDKADADLNDAFIKLMSRSDR